MSSVGINPKHEESLGSFLQADRLSEWTWTLGYTAVLSMVSVARYNLWLATGTNLGFYLQTLWLALHHAPFWTSSYGATGYGSPLIVMLLAPIYGIGGVGAVLVLQAFAFGVGYLLLRRIAQALGASHGWAHTVGTVYLLYPAVVGVNLLGLHQEAFELPLLFALVLVAVNERWLSYTILVIVSALVGGTLPISLVGLGIVVMVRGRAKWGIVAMVLAAFVLLTNMALASHLTHGVLSPWIAADVWLSVAVEVGRHPELLWHWIVYPTAWENLASITAPVIALVAIGRRRLVSAWWIPVLLYLGPALMMSDSSSAADFSSLTLPALPFAFTGMLAAVSTPKVSGGRIRAVAVILSVVCLVIFVGPQITKEWVTRLPNNQTLVSSQAVVPANAPVVAQNLVISHYVDREYAWLPSRAWTRTLPAGTYVVVDSAIAVPRAKSAALMSTEYMGALVQRRLATLVYSENHVLVYRIVEPVVPARQIRLQGGGLR